MRQMAIIVLLGLILCVGNAEAVEFKLGEFNISMTPPETGHISYASDTYDESVINTATISPPLFLSYKVTVLTSLSKPIEEFKSTPISGYGSLSNIEMDGKPAVMILANQFTTVEYVKDNNTLITLQFEETEGTDSSNSITETLKSFRATRIQD
jgi:hypothetical protein